MSPVCPFCIVTSGRCPKIIPQATEGFHLPGSNLVQVYKLNSFILADLINVSGNIFNPEIFPQQENLHLYSLHINTPKLPHTCNVNYRIAISDWAKFSFYIFR